MKSLKQLYDNQGSEYAPEKKNKPEVLMPGSNKPQGSFHAAGGADSDAGYSLSGNNSPKVGERITIPGRAGEIASVTKYAGPSQISTYKGSAGDTNFFKNDNKYNRDFVEGLGN